MLTHAVAGRGKYISRVHVVDIAATVLLSMQKPSKSGRVYNVADNEPCERAVVIDYAMRLLGMQEQAHAPAMREGRGEAGVVTLAGGGSVGGAPSASIGSVRMGRSDNKRVCNARMLSELSVQVRVERERGHRQRT
jgi:hypothetical protein